MELKEYLEQQIKENETEAEKSKARYNFITGWIACCHNIVKVIHDSEQQEKENKT